jgi:hypothetical protein
MHIIGTHVTTIVQYTRGYSQSPETPHIHPYIADTIVRPHFPHSAIHVRMIYGQYG